MKAWRAAIPIAARRLNFPATRWSILPVIEMTYNSIPNSEALGKMMITEMLACWPETAEVFHDHAMACVGCAVASFYTVIDAALVYGLSPELLIEEMLAKIHSSVAD